MGRNTKIIIGCIILVVLGPFVFVGSLMFFGWQQPADESCLGTVSGGDSGSVPISTTGLTVKGQPVDEDSAEIVVTAGSIIKGRADIAAEHKEAATVIIIAVGIVETGVKNLDGGDRDSLGWLQQRPSQGWGTPEQIMQVGYATNKFLDYLVTIPKWWDLPYGVAAAEVQRPAVEYRGRYALYVPEAQALYNRLVQLLEGCIPGNVDTLGDLAVRAALTQLGSVYTWDTPANGASFNAWAYEQAGASIPSDITEQATFQGNEEAGLASTSFTAAEIQSGAATLEAGDMLYWGNGDSLEDAEHTGLYVSSSSGQGTEFTLGSYNIHTGAGAVTRAQRSKQVIADQDWSIVGFQEVENAETYNALRSTFQGTKYAIYPSNPSRIYRNGLNARTILYDTERFELVRDPITNEPKVDEVQFKRMEQDGDPQPAHAPIIWLRDRLTLQQIIVMNTHNPAFPRYAFERKLAAEAYADKIDELKAEGLPIFFTGDFNSGYWLRPDGNVTFNDDPANLDYCKLTANGRMQDAKDIFEGIADNNGGYCPRLQTRTGQNSVDHIFVTPGVKVTKFGEVSRAVTLSDHAAMYARVSVPGVAENTVATSKLGVYVGPRQDKGVIKLQKVASQDLLGAVRLTQRTPSISVSGETTLPIIKSQYSLTATFGQTGPYWETAHTGQDFSADPGIRVYAVASGEITFAGIQGPYGNRIEVTSANGTEISYSHLSGYALKSGTVSAGTLIGYVGATGNVTGPHLHLEVKDPTGTLVDPLVFLRQNGLDP